jgi:nitroreductase
MKLSQPIAEVIRNRSSKRRYEERPIESDARGVLDDFLSSDSSIDVPFSSALRLKLVAANEGDRSSLKGLGTYGMIRGAPGFVVGAVKRSWKDMEDFGFAMERTILLATNLGLGTCWLGGTFTKSSFAEKIGARDDEIVPAVVAIGHATAQRSALDKVVRWGAKSKNRRPWNELFFSESFERTLSPEDAGDFSTAFEMVRLAPSASNKQPWRAVVAPDGRSVHFFLYRDPSYNRNMKKMKLADLQRVDMGIAFCHFWLATQEDGLDGAWSTDPPDVGRIPDGTEFVASWISS